MPLDERLLPTDELDGPQMLSPRPVLWKDTRPVLPVRLNHSATLALDRADAHPARRPNGQHCGRALIDDAGVATIERDSKAVDLSPTEHESAVSEIQAEQIDVRRLVKRPRIAHPAVRARLCWSHRPLAPVAHRRARDPGAASNLGRTRTASMPLIDDLAILVRPHRLNVPAP